MIDKGLLECMKRDAGLVMNAPGNAFLADDLACHVLALAEEVERLNAVVAGLEAKAKETDQ
jgi:hypothetical protein